MCPRPPYSVLRIKRRSLRPQELTKGSLLLFYTCFYATMSLAIPDAQDPWLVDPLDIGGAPAMVDLTHADFMLTTINLTNTSLFPVLPHPSMSCSHLSSIVNPRLADSLKLGGGDTAGSSLLRCSKQQQRYHNMGFFSIILLSQQPRTSFASMMYKNPTLW